jgi:SAM-dependent methyltransferase
LVADRLEDGHLVATDRSAKMIAAARERNRHQSEAGRLTLVIAEAADLPALGPFDLGFAVDVNVFGGSCEPELHCLRRQLREGGVFHFVHRPPVDTKVERFAENLRVWLPQCGFVVEEQLVERVDGSRILGVRALAV